MTSPQRPVLRYYGGKWLLAPWIISQFPEHRVYCEPFGGAGSVLMRKDRSYAEVYNDLDGEIVNLFRVLQDQESSTRLFELLNLTPFARDEFNTAYEPTTDPIEKSRRLIIRAYMGFGSDGHNILSGKTGFRANSNRSGSTPAHDWANYPEEVPAFYERLRGVCIENRDASEVMAQQDSEDTLHFVDPPYMAETRGAKQHGYVHEMSDDQHATLCEFLKTLKGMVVLCGYDNELYKSLGWKSVKREAHADGARDRVEILWFNPQAWERRPQMSLLDYIGSAAPVVPKKCHQYGAAPCTKCKRPTISKSGVCETCRTVACKCGTVFAPRNVGILMCSDCRNVVRMRKQGKVECT